MDRNKYEKITDDIMIIANKVLLRMNVSLSFYNNTNNKRNVYHREIEYFSNKTNSNLINIKRNFDYYLTIENISIENRDYIRIGLTDIMKLRCALDQAYKFFSDPKYDNLYVKINGELHLYKQVDPILITGLSMDKYLRFEPCVYEDFRGELQMGLRMYLSSSTSYCDISLNRLDAFIYIINTINLFESAQLMLNYFERPEFGYNLFHFNTEPGDDEELNFEGKDNRKITSNKPKSYFDKMRKLEED